MTQKTHYPLKVIIVHHINFKGVKVSLTTTLLQFQKEKQKNFYAFVRTSIQSCAKFDQYSCPSNLQMHEQKGSYRPNCLNLL